MAAKLIIFFIVLATLGGVYWFMIRPVMVSNPTLKPIFDRMDEQEATFWGLFTTLVKGWKNIIWARFLAISGAVAAVMAEVVPQIQAFMQVPGLDEWLAPRWMGLLGLILMVVGFVNERLRYATTGPVAVLPASDPLDPVAPLALAAVAAAVAPAPTGVIGEMGTPETVAPVEPAPEPVPPPAPVP